MQTLLKSTNAYRLLQTEAQNGQLSHAYLLDFSDSRNLRIALKTFAKLFFECANEEENSFAARRVSQLIDDETFSDCLFFPTDGKKLTVEDAEKIQEESTLSPVEGDKKLFILCDFSEANVQTQNKLLKLLEEPPQGVVFLLGATTVFPVLQTVRSRVKTLTILPFETSEVEACLHRIYKDAFDGRTMAICAAASNGRVGEAQNILEGGQYKTLTENAFALTLCGVSRLPLLVRQLGETKYPKELLALLRLIYRDALVWKTRGDKNKLILQSEWETLQQVASTHTAAALIYAQECLSAAEKEVQFNAVFPQCIQLCMAKIQEKNKQSKGL